jgi:serine/threonine-protein kinase
MAPERATGDTRLTPALDVYALGAVLYEGLTGRPPFHAWEPKEALRQVVEDQPVPPRRLQPVVPCELEAICLKCLEKKPEHRYLSAVALAEDLRRFRAGEAIAARPRRSGRKWSRRVAIAAGLAAVAALGLAGVALSMWK